MEQDKNSPMGNDWNSDKPAVPGMSCDQVARFLSAYMTTARAITHEATHLDRLKLLHGMLGTQIKVIESMKGDDLAETFMQENAFISMGSLGRAMQDCAGLDDGVISELCSHAVQIFTEMINKAGPEKIAISHVQYMVRINGEATFDNMGKLHIGVVLVDNEELIKSLLSREDTNKLVGIVMDSHKKADDKNGQGSN